MSFKLIRPRSTGRWDLTPAMAGIVSGQLIVEREGDTVWLDFRDLVSDSESTYVHWRGLLPVGMQPPESETSNYIDLALPQRVAADTKGPMRVDIYGGVGIYNHTGTIRGLVAFRTTQAMLTTVPGGVKL